MHILISKFFFFIIFIFKVCLFLKYKNFSGYNYCVIKTCGLYSKYFYY